MHAFKRMEEERKAASRAAQSADSAGSGAPVSEEALQWFLTNNVAVTSDAYWAPDDAHMEAARATRPWHSNENFFTSVKVSAVAAVKMLIHAKRGMPQEGRDNWFEVMGLMMGHFKDNVMYVTDSFGLPVDASEVECSMNENSMIYQAEYMNYHRRVGKPDKGCIGWYHSHPGYTCFLSGIDVNTQQLNQTTQDPWVAIVVDPVGTIASGKMDMKAFRTYTDDYVSSKGDTLELSTNLIKKKGLYANKYYELPITLVRSTNDAVQLDALLGQYWALTFSTNPLIANQGFHTRQLLEIAGVVDEACGCRKKAEQGNRVDLSMLTGLSPSSSAGTTTTATAAMTRTAGHGGATTFSAPFVYDAQWGPYQRPVEHAVEKKKPTDLLGAQGPPAMLAIQLSSNLTGEVLLGGVQLSVKNKVFDCGTGAEY